MSWNITSMGEFHDPRQILSGRRILIVEDEALVAMMIEDFLTDLGCQIIGPVSNAEDALGLIRETALDGATLDINLGSEEVLPVAEALEAQGVPFMIISGYDRENVRSRYNKWPIIQKPFTSNSLAEGLVRLVGR